ncbi:hypothetical protein KI387_018623, partial [Taxus chinensis]
VELANEVPQNIPAQLVEVVTNSQPKVDDPVLSPPTFEEPPQMEEMVTTSLSEQEDPISATPE